MGLEALTFFFGLEALAFFGELLLHHERMNLSPYHKGLTDYHTTIELQMATTALLQDVYIYVRMHVHIGSLLLENVLRIVILATIAPSNALQNASHS